MQEERYLMWPSLAERETYVQGYAAVNQHNLKSNKFLPNPYSEVTEALLWEAWEVGFNDAFQDEMVVLRIIEEMSGE
jgi:hypothetical protein